MVENTNLEESSIIEMSTPKKPSILDFMKKNGSFIIDPNGVSVWAFSSGNSPVTVSVSYDTGTVKGTVSHTFIQKL